MTRQRPDAPATFQRAAESLHKAVIRPEVEVEDMPAPQRLAPHAAALSASVYPQDAGDDEEELAVGRLIVLYDPEGQRGWDGPFRLVAYVRADMEPEIASDPLLGPVGWSWLTDSLEACGAGFAEAGGTVTRAVSEGFGNKGGQPITTELELRASWSPRGPGGEPLGEDVDLSPHVSAWCDLMAQAAGLPPAPPGVAALPPGTARARRS